MAEPTSDKDSIDQLNTSRETSPIRPARTVSAIPQLSRSRKGSQEFSPTRNAGTNGTTSTIPSAAAVQRALSAQRPILNSTTADGSSEGTRADRSMRSGQNSPSWPTSPRLKSPPPSVKSNRSVSTKKNENEHAQSNTSVKRLATVSAPELAAAMLVPDRDQSASQSNLRPPGRGISSQASGLETVAESSVPTTPSIGPLTSPLSEAGLHVNSLDQQREITPDIASVLEGELSGGDRNSRINGDKASQGSNSRAPSVTRPATNMSRRSFTSLTGAKAKTSSEPVRTMTIETEPVSSVAPLLGTDRGVSGREGTGSVRTKPSNETIRPKKEKKRTARKTPSLHAGTVTSKADIFEAKVASAVDEADSSDSDETFVYESNPPDTRTSRHHSRTPSATSLVSQEQFSTRNKHGLRTGGPAIAGKKSMKFSNSAYREQGDGESGPEGRNSVRNSSTTRHHHIGRHGRSGHTSLFDHDSPFTQAQKSNSPRTPGNNNGRNSRPNSPRIANGRTTNTFRKGVAGTFDIDEDAADDERAPLMGSVRVNRSRHGRRPHPTNFRHVEFSDMDERGFFSRYGGCLIVSLLVLTVCVGVAMFVVGLSQPLVDVSIKKILNILASEQEIMLDLQVQASNTNLFPVTVNDLDINVFAQSPYAGSSADWRHQEHQTLRWASRRPKTEADAARWEFPFPPFRSDDGVDKGTDPIDDEPGTQKLLLGRIFEFDSPLIFQADPFRHRSSVSAGEIRLAKPGNSTEEGGSARWERVLQHQFDLIVRGVIKYQLPLSSHVRSAKILGRATVNPDDETPGKAIERMAIKLL